MKPFSRIKLWMFQKTVTLLWSDAQIWQRASEELCRRTLITLMWNSDSFKRKRRFRLTNGGKREKNRLLFALSVITYMIKMLTGIPLKCHYLGEWVPPWNLKFLGQKNTSHMNIRIKKKKTHLQGSDGDRWCLFSISNPERWINPWRKMILNLFQIQLL